MPGSTSSAVPSASTAATPQSGTAPIANQDAAELKYPPCSSVAKHAVAIATQNFLFSQTDCAGEKLTGDGVDSMVLLRGNNSADSIAPLSADIILPVTEWLPETVTSFMIPQLAYSVALDQNSTADDKLDPEKLMCTDDIAAITIGLNPNIAPLSNDQFNGMLSDNSAKLLSAFSASVIQSQKGGAEDVRKTLADVQSIIEDFKDFHRQFGDFALGAMYDTQEQYLNAYIISPKGADACAPMMKHKLAATLVTGYAAILKTPPKKMTLTCDQSIKQEFKLQKAAQFGHACLSPVLNLNAIATRPLTYNIQRIQK